jgi:aminoglycoside phosphotransferase (APT) family kinase protein
MPFGHHGRVGWDAAIHRAATEAVGSEIRIVGPTARGESRSTLDAVVGDVEVVLKVLASGPGVVENQQRLVRLIRRLRARGYPAPEYLGVGTAGRVVVTAQRRVAGDTLEAGPGRPVDAGVLASTLPAILAAVELQADAGDLPQPPWPGWLLDTLTSGGDGYCLHSTMRGRPDTSMILDRVIRIGSDHSRDDARTTDIVHFDLSPANVLHRDGQLTGIIDWNVPFDGAGQGDRGFDVATLLFYTYDNEATRGPLWDRAIAISGPRWTAVYLAHLVLRQVEWTVRHRPGGEEEHRFIAISERVLAECDQKWAT